MKPIKLEELETIINYKFSNNKLLIEALTHPNTNRQEKLYGSKNYERLEFLGDSILNFIISELVFTSFSDKEGILAKKRAVLVCKETLVKIAREINIGKYIIFAENNDSNVERFNETNLENSLEALIAAIYLDSDIKIVKNFILSYWLKYLDNKLYLNNDPKSSVQEWAQKMGKPLPEYVIINQEGASHSPVFEVELRIQGEPPIIARGSSKKRAERDAANFFLIKHNLSYKTLD